jgi:hypothetical protein
MKCLNPLLEFRLDNFFIQKVSEMGAFPSFFSPTLFKPPHKVLKFTELSLHGKSRKKKMHVSIITDDLFPHYLFNQTEIFNFLKLRHSLGA